MVSGNLITRNYTNFRGVDFSNRKDEVSLVRSPDALNMWRNYKNSNGKCIETRPDIEVLATYADSIKGLFFYTVNGRKHRIVHAGTKLYDDTNVIYTGMANAKSSYFVYGSKLYIKDGLNYLVYDGSTVSKVEGYIPTTTISRSPSGGGTLYEDVNLLTGIRKNSFVADGASKEYVLDVESFDTDYVVRVWINDEEKLGGFTASPDKGIVTFSSAPTVPATTGQDNVVIQFRRTVSGYRERIEKCTLLEVFDNRVFFSGNPDYPNVLWHSSLDNPAYCSDLDYYEEGTDDSAVKAIVTGNNALWVMKEASQTNTTIFYHNPTVDSEYGKIYPSTHSSISTGCISTGVNFNDDICFFSERGMEAISSDVTTEQVIEHRSSVIDNRLLNETNYKNAILEEWEGYLLIIIDNKIYLADSREMMKNNNHEEYEFYYWELGINVTGTRVDNGVLYLYSDKNIYTLTNNNNLRVVNSYWTTIDDEFKYPQYQKITNKKGFVIDMEGEITLSVKTDNNAYQVINKYKAPKGYVVAKVKKKKWKSIQLKFSSNTPFSLYSCTLESYVGGYIKK